MLKNIFVFLKCYFCLKTVLIPNFSNILVNWYEQNLRELPWRKTRNPYKIWLSEIILQQTRVAQGLPYYEKFVAAFPTVFDLANADEQEVLKLWQGLGYYSRARNLHYSAKLVLEHYNGVFPNTYKELLTLKGVGVYTASAVASFSNDEAVPVVDGNVYRVLSRIFGIFTPINSSEAEKEFKELAYSLLDLQNPAQHNQAIMEFGALCCVPKKPNCLFCPFQSHCYSFNNNTISELPVKLKKTKITKKYFSYLVLKNDASEVLIHKRVGRGIWQHLYEFPLINSDQKISLEASRKQFEELLGLSINSQDFKLVHEFEKPHKLSHQHIYAHFFEYNIKGELSSKDFTAINVDEFSVYPVPILISNFIKAYPIN